MKKYLLTGIITLLPIALTVIVVVWAFNLFTEPFVGLVESMIHGTEHLFGVSVTGHVQLVFFASRIIALFLLVALLMTLGFIANRFFFRIFLELFQKIVMKIPIARTVYGVTKEIAKGLIKTDKKLFSKTVLIPFPFMKTRVIGLVSDPLPATLQDCLPEESLCIFVPTSPHPISGFLVLTPKEDVTDIPLSTEEAFKFLISCGTTFQGSEKKG